MKLFVVLVIALYSVSSMADVLSVAIEHPRINKRPSFAHKVVCHSQCDNTLKKNIKSLFVLADTGKLPQTSKIPSRLRYVNVQISEGNKSHSFELGSPEFYSGEELTKFTAVNKLLVMIEFSISSKQAGKE